MRRYILLFILLCLHGMARGQTEGYSCYFWFDGQQGKPQTTAVVQGSFDVDVTVLPEGIHTFHCLVIENDTAVSSPIVRYFMKAPKTNTSIKGYYWFDEDTNVREVTTTNGTFEVDASSLSEGLHQFHYQALQTGGTTSLSVTSYFLKTAQAHAGEEFTCLCTVDGNMVHQEALSADGGAIHWNLDMNDIADGLHKMQIDVLLSNGALSGCQERYFVKMPNADSSFNGFYWFDEETYIREAPVTNGTFEVDASSLSDGFHKFHYQVMQTGGTTSLPTANYFLKTAQVNPDDKLTCICTVDGQLRHVEKLSQQGGIIHWDLDMQVLADGVHRIQLQAVTQSGALSSTYTSYFMRIASYEDLSQMYCVYTVDGSSLNNRSNVVSHHGSFHFDLDLSELEEGLHYISFMLHNDRGSSTKAQTRFFVKTPAGGNGIMQYQYWLNEDSLEQAKTVKLSEKVNPLQLMTLLPVESRPLRSSLFHFDTSSGKPMIYAKNTIHLRFYDAAMRFSDAAKDYADYSVSKYVEPVGSLEPSQTFEMVAENDIRWYTLQAAPGDTTAFRLSQPATVQMFAPSGEEVFKTSEDASVKWSGINVWEEGTYYLAVHDVTGSKENMTLEYMHMDKYDVVDWDVHRVGNGGCSTISFKGNGFRDLYAVDLVIAPGDTIHSVDVSHDNDAETAVSFDFTAATLGDYNAVFHFTEEDKPIVGVVTVEEAIDIELATDVSFPSSFLRGTSTTYTIMITNKGNMTAYNVPIYVYVSSPTDQGIDRIDLYGNQVRNLATSIYSKNLSEGLLDTLRLAEKYWGILYYLKSGRSVSEDTGDSATIRNGYIWKDIKPCEKAIIQVKIAASENIYAWFTVPDTWETEHIDTLPKYGLKRMSNSMSSCIIKSLTDCYAESLKVNPSVIPRSVVNWSGFLPLRPRYMRKGSSIVDCIWEYKRKPNCPPVPPNGGNSNMTNSIDPNDIFGYLSEAGSKFIADSVARVNYTIEFENDTTFATAAAHTIVIKDTLDSRYFDLTKFMPMGIRIGEHETFLDAADVVTKNNVTSFVKTIDMRPEINAIAQVDGTFSYSTGIAQWTFQSLDPMTMEPTDDLMQGILPVNFNGTSGIGEVMFEVGVKQGKADGTEIMNRAGIVFDYEEAILTPTWTNIVDAVAPSSVIDNSWMVNDSTLRIAADGFDARSGVWKYTWYVQAGENAPWWNEGETESPQFDYHIYEGIDYGFCVLATDFAGNVEQKVIERERGFKTYGQDYEDGISPLPTSPEEEESVFDLSGRQIENGKSSNRKYPKGVIIRNRKKTLVTE